MSTLAVVEEILRETQVPMSVRQIVEHAGDRLPTRSKTPDTVVARDLSMDIKKKGEASIFIRTAPGRYTIRELHMRKLTEQQDATAAQAVPPAAAVIPPGDDTASAAHYDGVASVTDGDGVTSVTDGDGVADGHDQATPVLASAMKSERAAPLPAKKPVMPDEHTSSHRG